MKFGIIGAGRWAEVHQKALKDVGATLSTVLISSEASKNRVISDWGVHATTHMQTFLSYDTEAVIIASPNYLHAKHSIICLQSGKHVLVEKPFATTLEDAQKMLGVAQQANKLLANGLEMRVFTLFKKVKEVIDENKIGKPIHLNLNLFRRPYSEGTGGWKTDPKKLGSSILEEPIHYLDLARWYLLETSGEPRALQAWSNARSGHESFDENLDIRLEYEDGTNVLITRSIAAFEHNIQLKIVGEKGALSAEWHGKMDLDRKPSCKLWLHNSGNRDEAARSIPIAQETGHAFDLPKQTQAFIDAIRKHKSPAASAEDGLASVRLCLAVEESLKEARVVLL